MVLKVELNEDSYDIVIEKGALNNITKYLNLKRKVLIVTDSGIPVEYIRKVADLTKEGYVFTIPQGEENKNFENYYAIISYLIEKEFTKSDCIIALGGGVVGDLAGFVSSTYKRGIPFYNIPTTLLSMVDSSIGGKTAIDFKLTKNIVGSFYQPQKVIIDIDVLKSLDKRQLYSGLVEAIKMGITSNKKLFYLIKNTSSLENVLEEIVIESIKIKKKIIEIDPKEKGIRKILNFGHTIGHAIESLMMGNLYHGECVGLGMLYMCSEHVRKEIEEVLTKYHLPIHHNVSKEELLKYINYDKKISGTGITIIFVEEIGENEMRTIDISNIISYL